MILKPTIAPDKAFVLASFTGGCSTGLKVGVDDFHRLAGFIELPGVAGLRRFLFIASSITKLGKLSFNNA